ncbi:MAG: NADH-quinone oxidoreductase subunit NuoG [Actinobacteria bacterium]|nr:NADH-quinone oxidoreductase subunit NuoG [Actinomycetota bacterium]
MSKEEQSNETVTITVDGREMNVPAGELLIKAAQDHGVYIPRFCWHERMKPVGMCRMCLVQVDGVRGLPPACTTRVTDGMVVDTESAEVRKAQEGVLEFLLINHPLDCPVCDRGGECPLQDHTLAFGAGESRFVEEKRHFPKPIAISDLVDLDRERCIQCGRCTRFAAEIAGDPLIDFVERGGRMQVLTFPDEPFSSYFSGNTVQICPVGALLAHPYRFRARPWDLETVETSCLACSVGCRGALQSSTNVLVRFLGVDSDPVNHGWLCDKGRFGFEYVHSAERATAPAVKKRDDFVEVSWPEALDAAADGLTEAVAEHGPESVALIGGARGTNEDAYAWARLMKGVLGTDNVDCHLGDGLSAGVTLGLPQARIADCDTARAVVLMAPDLKEELPVLFLRLRRAAVELGVPIIDIAPRDHGLSPYAAAKIRYRPGEQGGVCEQLLAAIQGKSPKGDSQGQIAEAAKVLAGKIDTVVVLGRPSLAEPAEATNRAAAALAGLPGVRFLSALRRGNVHGALDMGLAPGVLPGRVGLDEGREWFGAHWGVVPAQRGLDTEGILRQAAASKIKALIILGSNVVADFPDRDLALQALEAIPFVVAVGAFVTEASRHADVLLPTALWGEKDGSATNLEGRVMRLARKVTPSGTSMEDWRIAVELSARFDVEFAFETVYEVEAEIARVAAAYREVTPQTLLLARDGVVVPPGREEPVFGRPGHPITPWADAEPGMIGGQEVQVLIQGRVVPPDVQADAVEVLEVAELVDTDAGVDPRVPPPLLEWDGSFDRLEIPQQDSYALRLVSGRRLYDAGLGVQLSPPTAQLAEEAVLLVNPWNFESLGVAEGDRVKITSSRGSVVLAVRSDPGTPKGVAFLPFNQPGHAAADLIEVGTSVTDVQVETLS